MPGLVAILLMVIAWIFIGIRNHSDDRATAEAAHVASMKAAQDKKAADASQEAAQAKIEEERRAADVEQQRQYNAQVQEDQHRKVTLQQLKAAYFDCLNQTRHAAGSCAEQYGDWQSAAEAAIREESQPQPIAPK